MPLLKRYAAPLLILLILAAGGAGCGGPLKVVYNPPPLPPLPETGLKAPDLNGPVSVEVLPFIDSRPDTLNARVIGRITVTVADMSGETLELSEPPARILTDAFTTELRTAGFIVERPGEERVAAGTGADFVLTGELREFRLDIGSRDVISIEAAVEIKDREGTIYSGVKKESSDRYAGVMGNSRGTISKFISVTISRLAREIIDEARVEMAGLANKPAIPSQSTSAPPAPPAPPPTEALRGAAGMPEGLGRLVITTVPARAGVYIDGVYYGLTPMELDLAPGVYALEVKKDGYIGLKEKVAVGAGRVTELESTLDTEGE
jgi:hypothetical protein